MIEVSTCLVLGAGASVPYGFPVGDRLMEEIITTVATANDKRSNALRKAGFGGGILKECLTCGCTGKQPR